MFPVAISVTGSVAGFPADLALSDCYVLIKLLGSAKEDPGSKSGVLSLKILCLINCFKCNFHCSWWLVSVSNKVVVNDFMAFSLGDLIDVPKHLVYFVLQGFICVVSIRPCYEEEVGST